MNTRLDWIAAVGGAETVGLSVRRQCAVAGVTRSWVYAHASADGVDEQDMQLLRLIDAAYPRRPCYGSRRMVVSLRAQGFEVNRKRVQRLLRVLGLAGRVPGPHTSTPHPAHQTYPYLLRGMAITRPNQVWSTDIPYVRLAHGCAYRVAIIDGYSRRVLAWRLSNTLDAGFCIDCLAEALRSVFMVERRSSTPTRGRNLLAWRSRGSCVRRASPSAWTGGDGRWTTCLSSDCGGRLSMRISILTHL